MCDTDFDVSFFVFFILFFFCAGMWLGETLRKKKAEKKVGREPMAPPTTLQPSEEDDKSRTFEIKMGANLEKKTKQESLKKQQQ